MLAEHMTEEDIPLCERMLPKALDAADKCIPPMNASVTVKARPLRAVLAER